MYYAIYTMRYVDLFSSGGSLYDGFGAVSEKWNDFHLFARRVVVLFIERLHIPRLPEQNVRVNISTVYSGYERHS